MTTALPPKNIKPLEGYTAMLNMDVATTATSVITDMTGNTNYPNSPVDLTVLKTANDTYLSLIAEARDGSKKVIAEMKKQRAVVIKMLRLLGRYVEVTCDGDMAIFTSSGFKPASNTKTPAVPLSPPTIAKVTHSVNSGQVVVQIKAHRKAISYMLRSAPVGAGGTLGPWTELLVSSAKPATTVIGLTPGTVYAFQARAQGKVGYTDWSDSTTFMCT